MITDFIIIEDEPLAAERVKGFAARLPYLNWRGTFTSAADGSAFLDAHHVHLVFLDINLGAMSGIELLENSSTGAQVILTTAYQEYALRGYDLDIADYLLKPFTFERFVRAVEKATVRQSLLSPNAPGYFFVKTEYRLEKVDFSDLLFVEGMRDYRRIHTGSKKIMTLQTFGDLGKHLPSSVMRVHRSYMVNLDKVDALERDELRIGERLIPVSQSYRNLLFERLRLRG